MFVSGLPDVQACLPVGAAEPGVGDPHAARAGELVFKFEKLKNSIEVASAKPWHLKVQRVAAGRPANGAGAGLPAHADELVLLRQVGPAGGEVERLWRGEELFMLALLSLFLIFHLHLPRPRTEEPLGAPGGSQVGEVAPELGHLLTEVRILVFTLSDNFTFAKP